VVALSVRLAMPSPNCEPNGAPLLGHVEARLFTPPLRELTRETSYGFAVIDFAANVLGAPLDPWEAWAVIHAGELLQDGRPRFRIMLILVARQNGKTHLFKVLALFWAFIEQWPLTVLTSTNLEYAKSAWVEAVAMAEAVEELAEQIPPNGVLQGNNDVHMKTVDGCKLKIAASNRKGGRSLSIDRLGCDEIREHQDWSAWDAAYNAMNARPFGQAFAISNQGDDQSVVLDAFRETALDFITDGTGDPRLGLLEWSAPDGVDVLDQRGWAAANPNLGRRLDVDTIAGAAVRAAKLGGAVEAGFRTEVLCQRVKALDAAVDAAKWAACRVVGDMSGLRGAVALCVDVSPDLQHATVAAAAPMADGRVRVEGVAAFAGGAATAELRAALPGLVRKVRPRVLGWIPGGPGAALVADLAERKGRAGWPPPGVAVVEIGAEVPSICMGLADMVHTLALAHAGEALLTRHVTAASKLPMPGDRWRFQRKGEGHCDAAYAAAGAVHLARTLPAPVGRPRVVVAKSLEG